MLSAGLEHAVSNPTNTHGRPIVDAEVTTSRAQKTTDYFDEMSSSYPWLGLWRIKKGESEEKSNVSIPTPFNSLGHLFFRLWSSFPYFSQADALNTYHDLTRGRTCQMCPLLWTFFAPSVVTWLPSFIPSVRICSEVWMILFPQVENTDALFYLPLQPIVCFKLVRSQMMAGVVGLQSFPGFCSLPFAWFLKIFPVAYWNLSSY